MLQDLTFYVLYHIIAMMDKKFDVVTIGAGLGALTAASILAKKGYKVAMVEQHDIPGGMATTFKRKNLTVEVGLHELDGMDEKNLKTKLFRFLGIYDKLAFIRLPQFYRFIYGSTDIVVPDSTEEAKALFIEKYPKEKKGIQKFFKTILAIQKEVDRMPLKPWKMLLLLPIFPFVFPNLMRNMKQNLGDFLDQIFETEEIKLALIANLAYYHDDPYTMTMLYYSVAQASYYEGGGYYIKGGSQNLSNAMADVVTENGGSIFYKKMVSEIIIENGKAAGVKMVSIKGRNKLGEDEEVIKADTVIAGASLPDVVNKLLPKDYSAKLSNLVENKENSPSVMTLYLGLNAPLNSFLKNKNANTYTTFYLHHSVRSIKDWHRMTKGNLRERTFVTVDYSTIDSGLTKNGKHFAVVCADDFGDDWPRDESEYKKKKKEAEEILLSKLEEEYPGVRKEIFYHELGTARTIERYTLNPGGSIYGFAQIPSQTGPYRPDVRSKIPGLYFASAWVNPGGGFTGVIMSGILASHAITGELF